MEPVRTCLGCRRRDTASRLVRCVALGGVVVADHSATMPGRGAWVHPTAECVDRAITRRAFGRALRADGPLDTSRVSEAVLARNQSEPPDGVPERNG